MPCYPIVQVEIGYESGWGWWDWDWEFCSELPSGPYHYTVVYRGKGR